MNEIDRRQQYELESVGDNESAKAFIQKKYDAERKQLQHRQDIANRERSLFDIAINTAVGISKASPDIPLMILAGVLGAVQAGIVLATPLPQYKLGKNIDGTDRYEGLAIAGEAGREIWHTDKETKVLDRPTLINVGKDDIIFPNHMTESILANRSITDRTLHQSTSNYRINQNKERYQVRQRSNALELSQNTINRISKGVAQANQNLPFNMSITDIDGSNTYQVKQNQRVKNRNKKHSLD